MIFPNDLKLYQKNYFVLNFNHKILIISFLKYIMIRTYNYLKQYLKKVNFFRKYLYLNFQVFLYQNNSKRKII
jgi:hypothetical protein